jgi:large subunit ribosomal protein L24
MAGLKVRKGDQVVVLTGKDKGKTGEVIVAMPSEGKVVVAGVNIAKRHTKPKRAGETGGIVEKPMPLQASNVAVIGPDGKPTRVGYKIKEDGTKVRISKRTGGEL